MSKQLELTRFLETAELAELGPGPRSGVQSQTQIEQQLASILPAAALTEDRQNLIRALILLWHDHLDAAHKIAQDVETPDGAFVHGIVHRREPDFGNAAYWFRRVGRHPAYAQIAERVSPMVQSTSLREQTGRLVQDGLWNPFAFIEACEKASDKPKAVHTPLREIQREEFHALLNALQG